MADEQTIERLKEALRDVYHVATTRDNYGPGERTRRELKNRMVEIQDIVQAALKDG